MQKKKISLGTIIVFTTIGILRGCEDYNLNKQLEAERNNHILNEGTRFEEIIVPPGNYDFEEIEFDYKK